MMKQSVAIPFSHQQHRPLPIPHGLFRLLIVALCLSFAPTFTAVAQTNAPAPLPPAAQEAVNKGIIAAKVPDYLLAIRYFEEARKLAPDAPVIYLNLGLAESKIPGRELRAIAWFSTYLAAYPDAPNAVAVKDQIDVLEVRNRSNTSRLIKAAQDGANKISDRDNNLEDVAELWAKAGDFTAALEIAERLREGTTSKHGAQLSIVANQRDVGDFTGMRKTADRIQDADLKRWTLLQLAQAQARSGDIAGAQKNVVEVQKTTDLIQNTSLKAKTQSDIASTQANIGDITGAQKTADLIQDAYYKSYAHHRIAILQAQSGEIAGAQKNLIEAQKAGDLIQNAASKNQAQGWIDFTKDIVTAWAKKSTRQLTSDVQALQRQPVITASDWLKKLDDSNKSNDCPLNTEPFLDLPGYLKSLPRSDDPQKVFDSLHKTAETIVKAQNVISGMLKQQAKK